METMPSFLPIRWYLWCFDYDRKCRDKRTDNKLGKCSRVSILIHSPLMKNEFTDQSN